MKAKNIHIIPIVILAALVLSAACTGTQEQTNPEISGYIEDLYSDNVETQKTAIKELINKGQTAVEPLIGVFSSGDQLASTGAATALIYIGEPSIEPLINSLGSSDQLENEWASITLAAMGTRAIPELIEIINTGSGTEKEQAAITLIRIGEPALPLLNLELNTNPDADQAEITSIIQSVYATQGLRERLENTTESA